MKHLPFSFLAFCVGFSAYAQVPSYVPTDGLVAWYPLDGMLDNSVSDEFDGLSFNGDFIPNRFDEENGAAGLPGNHLLELPLNPALLSNDFSISFWVFKRANSVHNPIQIWADGGPGRVNFGFNALYSNGAPFMNEGNCSGGYGDCAITDETTATPSNEWIHFVFVVKGDDSQIFLNGNELTLQKNCTLHLDCEDESMSLWFGGDVGGGATEYFNGDFDDIGVWHGALTPQEVWSIYEGEPLINFGCTDQMACNYIQQGLTASQYTDSLGYSIATLISSGYEPANLIGMEYGGGLIYNIEEQGDDLVISIVHPPEYADAPVPNMGLDPGSACGAGGQFGGSFLNAPEQCENLVLAGFDDWFLPTIDQVEQVYETLFYSAEFPVNVCATGASGFFKGIDYLSATENCRCYFGTGVTLCDAPATNAYEYFPVRQETMPFLTNQSECEYGCNYCGPGTTWDAEMQMCLPEMECDSLYNPDVDFDGFIGLTDLLAILSHYNNEWPPWECGDPLEYQGYDYETVQIGEQCWFAENLSYIPEGEAALTEGNVSSPAAYTSAVSEDSQIYYNHYATLEWDLCPTGWHVPSLEEWETGIAEYETGSLSVFDADGWRITLDGYWDGGVLQAGAQATLWSADINEGNGWGIFQNFQSSGGEYSGSSERDSGATLRCIQD